MKNKTNWQVTPKEGVEIQRNLREKINLKPIKRKIRLIGGCDMSLSMFGREGYAGFVVLSYPELEPVGESVVKSEINFPYIPGLLSFREIPMLLKAWQKLKVKPGVLVVDGVGIAHPRRMGIATHLGLILQVPTIGCSKKVLTGVYKEPPNKTGSYTYLHDKFTNEVIGAVIRTKVNVKPVFVSPGNLITLEESIEIILKCVRKHRLPEPTRLAHNKVNEYRIKDKK